MEHNQRNETKLIAIIGLLVSILLVMSVLFGVAYFSDVQHIGENSGLKSCYNKEL